jgi:hypothetical protein
MQRIGHMFHTRPRDFRRRRSPGICRGGVREILLIGGAAALLIGGFVVSLI